MDVALFDGYFHYREKGSSFWTEVMAGTTSFMMMAYIIVVNPGIFAALDSNLFGAVSVSTCLAAAVGTICMGLIANLPLAQASGMGLNAFFVYSVCFGFGFTYANALLFVLFDGVLFIILSVTGLRKLIFDAIPAPVKAAISLGIGAFIALLGWRDASIVINSDATGTDLVSFNVLNGVTWLDIMPKLVTLGTVAAIAVLSHKKVKGAMLISIIGGSIAYYVLGGLKLTDFSATMISPGKAISDFQQLSLGKVFTEGLDFSQYLSQEGASRASLVLVMATTTLAFCLVDMFDTMGTLYGACREMLVVNPETGEKEVPNMNRAMLADAIATTFGATVGTSTVTTFVESSAAPAAGGRTGLAAITTAFWFLLAIILTPITSLVPPCAYAAALIYVGYLMIRGVGEVDWMDETIGVPAFFAFMMMPFTYNISYGIAFALIIYLVINFFAGKRENIRAGTVVVALLFCVMFTVSR